MSKSKVTKKIDAWVRRHQGQHICGCGCGEQVYIKREHYRAGVPDFIKGHNFKGVYNPKIEGEIPDKPSRWDKLTEEDRERRLSQLKNFPRGELHPNWSGGFYITDSGYKHILIYDHPFSSDGYFPEHRLVIESWMKENNPEHKYMVVSKQGPVLSPDTVVHHRDKNKLNNSIQNLILMDSQVTHMKWHGHQGKESDLFFIFKDNIYCPWINL